LNLKKSIYHFIKKYFKAIYLINKVSLQLKKRKLGKILLYRFLIDSFFVFFQNIIKYQKVNHEFYKYAKKLRLSYNWFGFNAQIWIYIFKRFKLINKKIQILEIGSFEGLSTSYFLRYLKKSKLDAVDSLNKKTLFYKNLLFNKKKMRNFKYFNIKSDKFFKKFKKNYDLIYIDGSHYFKDVLNDADNSFKLLKKNGLIIFDDFLYDRESRNKKNKEYTNVIGGIMLFLSKTNNYKIIYVGHQFIMQKL
jgi:hypothetical protein